MEDVGPITEYRRQARFFVSQTTRHTFSPAKLAECYRQLVSTASCSVPVLSQLITGSGTWLNPRSVAIIEEVQAGHTGRVRRVRGNLMGKFNTAADSDSTLSPLDTEDLLMQ